MEIKLTAQELIEFEKHIVNLFANKKILAPVHLQDNNFETLIEIFKEINQDDWACGTWRFHGECLLKGVPKKSLIKSITDGHSISLCFKEYRIITSAIVGGIIPIALGIALDIKRKKQTNKVYCFVGEMSATTGIFFESVNYAKNNNLPIVFVISDNGKSVCTNTREVWNTNLLPYEPHETIRESEIYKSKHIWYYKYKLEYPHAGTGQRINF